MFKKDQISTTLSSATSTAVVEQVTSPFFYGQDIIVGMDYANDSVMTAKIEGSADNSTYSDLFAPGAMDGVGGGDTDIRMVDTSFTVTCPRYIKGTVSAFTSGSVKFWQMGGM